MARLETCLTTLKQKWGEKEWISGRFKYGTYGNVPYGAKTEMGREGMDFGQVYMARMETCPTALKHKWRESKRNWAGLYGTYGNVPYDAKTEMGREGMDFGQV